MRPAYGDIGRYHRASPKYPVSIDAKITRSRRDKFVGRTRRRREQTPTTWRRVVSLVQVVDHTRRRRPLHDQFTMLTDQTWRGSSSAVLCADFADRARGRARSRRLGDRLHQKLKHFVNINHKMLTATLAIVLRMYVSVYVYFTLHIVSLCFMYIACVFKLPYSCNGVRLT